MARLRKIVVALAVLIVAVVIAAVFFLDAAAARILATAATSVLGTDTTVRSLHLGLVDGRSVADGLRIEQPAGFPKGEMISVGHVAITAGLRELLSNDVVVEAIELKGVTVNLVEAGGKLNLQVVADRVASGDGAPAPSKAPAAAAQPSQRTVVVRKLTVSEIQVTASGTTGISDGATVSVTIPDIEVSDLGTNTTVGDLSEQLAQQIFEKLLVAIVQARIEGLPTEISAGLQSAASNLQGAAQGVIDAATSGVGQALEGVGGALKGLLGGDSPK